LATGEIHHNSACLLTFSDILPTNVTPSLRQDIPANQLTKINQSDRAFIHIGTIHVIPSIKTNNLFDAKRHSNATAVEDVKVISIREI